MHRRSGLSLIEMLAVVAIIAALTVLIVPRLAASGQDGDVGACHAYRGNVEIQVEIWRHNTGSWPAVDLSDIGGDAGYFPEGLPACPVDGTGYAIDSNGRVVGHDH